VRGNFEGGQVDGFEEAYSCLEVGETIGGFTVNEVGGAETLDKVEVGYGIERTARRRYYQRVYQRWKKRVGRGCRDMFRQTVCRMLGLTSDEFGRAAYRLSSCVLA